MQPSLQPNRPALRLTSISPAGIRGWQNMLSYTETAGIREDETEREERDPAAVRWQREWCRSTSHEWRKREATREERKRERESKRETVNVEQEGLIPHQRVWAGHFISVILHHGNDNDRLIDWTSYISWQNETFLRESKQIASRWRGQGIPKLSDVFHIPQKSR